MKAVFLKSKEKKEFLKLIRDQWGADCSDWQEKYAILKNEKDKYFLINKEVGDIEFEKLRISNIGLYIAEVKNNQIRLSIEGSQLIGPKATKNVLELKGSQVKSWIVGNELITDCKGTGFQIIKNNTDFLGAGKVINEKILNYVPKERRLQIKAFE